MALPFNRGVIPQGLARLFGIKGAFAPLVEETILPSVSVADLLDSPYLQYGSSVGRSLASVAVVGEVSCICATPGPNVALQILQINIRNPTAAPLDGAITIMNAGDIATAGLASTSQFIDLAMAPAKEARSSVLLRGSHTAIVGAEIGRFTVPADSMIQLTFPRPGLILFGNDEGGIPGITVWGEVVNTQLEACTFFGREWPLPG